MPFAMRDSASPPIADDKEFAFDLDSHATPIPMEMGAA